MVEHLLCKPKALGSVLSSRNEKQQQKRPSQAIRHHRDNYTAALFTIAKLSYENSLGAQQQSDAKGRCAVYTMDCFPITKTEVTPLAGSWIQREIIIVSELKSPQRDKYLLVLSLVVPRFYIDRPNHVGV